MKYKLLDSEEEFEQVLELQQTNLLSQLTNDEMNSEGFLTVKHDAALLKKMNTQEAGVLAKEGGKLAAYALAMTKALRNDVPLLVSMFDTFDQLEFKGKKLNEYNYIVVGQVCVSKDYRGQGVFDELYRAYKKFLSPKYAFAITEIARRNPRSLKAHERVGFQPLSDYVSPEGEHWEIVVWDWC